MPCRFLTESVDDSPRVTIVGSMETTHEIGTTGWYAEREAFRVEMAAKMAKREALVQRAMRRRLARARAGSAVVDMRTMDIATVDADGYVVAS